VNILYTGKCNEIDTRTRHSARALVSWAKKFFKSNGQISRSRHPSGWCDERSLEIADRATYRKPVTCTAMFQMRSLFTIC